MPIKKFIYAGNKWKARCAGFRDRDQKCDANHQNEIQTNDDDIAQVRQTIQTLDKKIANSENVIRQEVKDAYESKLYGAIGGVVSHFGVTPPAVGDRSVDVERAANDLKLFLTRRKQCVQQEQDLKNRRLQIEADYQKQKSDLRDEFVKEKQAFIQKTKQEYDLYKSRCVSNYCAASVVPTNAPKPPHTVVFGNQHAKISDLKTILCNDSLVLPYEVDVRNGGNFIINITDKDLYDGNLEKMIVGMLLKYIEFFPATKMHLGVFSSTLPSLNSLNALYRAMRDKGCTLLDAGVSAGNRLGELLDRITTYIVSPEDKIVTQACGDIYDLYDQLPESDPFQIILLHNAFADISEENLLKIYSYMSGYHKYGVRFIIVEDFSSIHMKNSARFVQALENIKKNCTQIMYNQGKPIVDGVQTNLVSLNDDFDGSKIISYVRMYLEQKSTAPYITYESIGFGTEKKDADNYESISIPIGKSGTNVCSISFTSISNGSTIPLANLILGVPRTGKSKLIDAMIYNAAIKYSPEDVIFHLLDFKDGAMSAPYTQDENKIPHVKVISANNDAEEAGFILDNIIAENKTRVKAFHALGTSLGIAIDNIAQYNKLIDDHRLKIPKMPRLIMAIDECQTLFDIDVLAAKMEDIIRKGRSQGIFIVLSTQAMTSNMRKVVRFIDGLYVFQSVDEDIQAVLDKPFHARVNKEVPTGSYQAFASNDKGKTCTKFKVAFYGEGRMGYYAQKVREEWSEICKEPFKPLVIGENSKLVLSASECESIYRLTKDFCVPLGENYQNRQPQYFFIGERNYAATLLVGSNEHIACGITTSILLSAIFNHIPVYGIDVSSAQALKRIKEKCFPQDQNVQIGAGKDYRKLLIKIYRIYQKRMQERDEDPTKKFSPIAFIVNGVHEITDYCSNTPYDEQSGMEQQASAVSQPPAVKDLLTTSFADFRSARKASLGTTKPKADEAIKLYARTSLLELIEKGSKLGIYVCIWFDKNDSSGERRILRDSCDVKILFPTFKTNKESYLEGSSFKEKMLARVNENMAFVEHAGKKLSDADSEMDGVRTYKRLRVYQYNLDDPDMIDFIKKFSIQ